MEARTKIEVLKNESKTHRDKDGTEYEIETVLVQIGTRHVLSVVAVNGVWLSYEIRGSHDRDLKPSDLEIMVLNKFMGMLNTAKKNELGKD